MSAAMATLLALLAGGAAWILGAPLLAALGLDWLGLPARLGLVILALSLLDAVSGRLARRQDHAEGGSDGG